MVANQQLNGQPEEAIANTLQEDTTVGYRPVMPMEMLWASGGDMPQITLRRDLEFMQMHPIVSIAMEYYKSGISGAEFWGGPDDNDTSNDKGKPISMDDKVSQFVLAHVERFWQRGAPILQEGGYPYGWAPGEHIYKEHDGMMVWSHLKGFFPNDGFVLTYKHQSVGIRIKNIRDPIQDPADRGVETTNHKEAAGGTVDLWFASKNIPAKAAWYPHRPRFNQFYGRSQLMGAWLPWRMLGWKDGMDQVVNAAVYRAGYRGPVVYHPNEDMQTGKQGVPGTQQDSRGMPRRSAQDVARQIGEWAKAGASFTCSSAQYPAAQGGGPKWKIDWPEHVMDVRPLVDAARWCEDRIMLGMGVPPELVKAGGTGSGYSGRSIPREAFLDQQQRIADAMLQMFVEQVIKPLVLWNFGDIPFNVQCKSLLKSQADDKQGQDQGQQGEGGDKDQKRSQAAKDAWAKKQGGKGGAGGAAPAQPPQPPSAPMSHNSKTLDIVRRVMARRAA